MEILNMTFAGIPVSTLLIVAGLGYGIHAAWKDWQERRELVKEMEEADKKFKEQYEWEPHMHNGVDLGRWVDKKGRRTL